MDGERLGARMGDSCTLLVGSIRSRQMNWTSPVSTERERNSRGLDGSTHSDCQEKRPIRPAGLWERRTRKAAEGRRDQQDYVSVHK